MMITYYKLAETDTSLLQKQLQNTQTNTATDQNIKPSLTLEAGKSYSIEELINRMIIYSDNLAYDLLLSNLDNRLLRQTYADLGVDISKADTNPNGNIISVKDYASFFRILFNSSYLSKPMSEKALKLLTQAEFKQGLIAGIPQNIEIAHKFGERRYLTTGEKQLHDCGIVYLPNKPYLLCIMTRGQDFDKLSQTIKQISQIVYTEISK